MKLDRYLSRPLVVRWAGFKSDTYALQNAGWEISAEQNFGLRSSRTSVRLAMRHQPMQMYAITHAIDEFHFEGYHRGWDNYAASERTLPEFQIAHIAPGIEVIRYPDNLSWFAPIDAKPQFDSITVRSIEDFGIFATPLARTEEIIVEPQSVAALLDRIKEIQMPEQAALRAKQRLRASRGSSLEFQPRQQFHAQILSIIDHREAA